MNVKGPSTTPLADPADEALAKAIRARRAGSALGREFYTDPDIFRGEADRFILHYWHCAGHRSSVSNPGDFFTVEMCGESVIIVCGQDRVVRALVNVCRHRGSRVCTESAGHVRGGAFVCPYHAWSYNLDGSLRAAPNIGATFDRRTHGLKEISLRILEGLIFISFAEEPPSLQNAIEAIAASARIYGWNDAKVAHQETYTVRANWKLVVENYFECYHCAPAHPEYAKFHVSARSAEEIATADERVCRQAKALGLEFSDVDHWGRPVPASDELAYAQRSSFDPGILTGSEDGSPVAPLMGGLPGYDGGMSFFGVGPTSACLAYSDHGIIYRFIPKTVDSTEMEVIWLVRSDAREGLDYDLRRLIWLWTVTSLADKRIIEVNQQGVKSRFYEPSAYTPMEVLTLNFTDALIDRLR